MLESIKMPPIESATENDIDGIFELLAPNAEKQLLLARSKDDIQLHLKNFLVIRDGSRLVGCAALRSYGDGLYEIRSLAVDDAFKGRGFGTRLVESCIEKAVKLDGMLVFTLTLRPNLFLQLGFTEVPIQTFHRDDKFREKIWADCRQCPKFDACNEKALVISLKTKV
ncbi:MAG: GNAT family N-acetyltransferase [Victivallales bacterium]|nr:GNAT family N-acetyltransferase [Victivallales bacterium]